VTVASPGAFTSVVVILITPLPRIVPIR